MLKGEPILLGEALMVVMSQGTGGGGGLLLRLGDEGPNGFWEVAVCSNLKGTCGGVCGSLIGVQPIVILSLCCNALSVKGFFVFRGGNWGSLILVPLGHSSVRRFGPCMVSSAFLLLIWRSVRPQFGRNSISTPFASSSEEKKKKKRTIHYQQSACIVIYTYLRLGKHAKRINSSSTTR